jgi:hypothetical protein
MRKITPILFGLVALATSTPMTAIAVPVNASMAATVAAAASNEQATLIHYRRGYRVARRAVYRGAYYGGYGYGGTYSPYAYSYPYGYSSYGMGYGRRYNRW